MIGWWLPWKCLVACVFFEESQQPTWPQVRHSRRCTQRLPDCRHSSHPSGVFASNVLIMSRWVHGASAMQPSLPERSTLPSGRLADDELEARPDLVDRDDLDVDEVG